MLPEVIISIRPQWCERIAIGDKTIELRKSRPKVDGPFKVYIYQTKANAFYHFLRSKGRINLAKYLDGARGAVIGEFVCDKVIDVFDLSGSRTWLNWALLADACVEEADALRYARDGDLYGWRISKLKIYQEARPLSDFGLECAPQSWGYVKDKETA